MARITMEQFIEGAENEEVLAMPEEELAEQELESQYEVAEATDETEELISNQERSIDTAEALESLREALESKGDLSATDIKLMRIATEMAVAGTGVQVNRLFPSLESNDPTIALEGFGDRIIDIVESIGKNIVRILKSIGNVINKFFLSFRSIESRTAKLLMKAEAKKKSGVTTAEDFSIKFRDIFYLSKGTGAVKDITEFKKEYKATLDMYDNAVDTIFKNVILTTKEYGMFTTFKDLTRVEETGKKFYKQTSDFMRSMIKDLKYKKQAKVNQYDMYVSDAGLANSSIEICVPNSNSFNMNDYEDMKKSIGLFNFRSNDSVAHGGKSPSDLQINQVKIGDVIEILEHNRNYFNIRIKYINKYTEIINSSQIAAERAVDVTINLIQAAIVTVAQANPISIGSGAAGAIATNVVGDVVGVAVGSSGAMMRWGLKELLFSYKAMSKNNSVIYGALHQCFDFIDGITSASVWTCADLLNKGRWK